MRKLILYSALSLDQYIADEHGGVDWLTAKEFLLPGEDYGYASFYDRIDTTIMGNNTYKKVLGFDVPFPYPDKKNYVLSRSDRASAKYVQFVHNNCIEFITDLKRTSGKDIWLVGGGEVNTLCHKHGIIDQLILAFIPVSLTKGIPLFADKDAMLHYELSDIRNYKNGVTQKTFNKK